jgi:hypothetical protein
MGARRWKQPTLEMAHRIVAFYPHRHLFATPTSFGLIGCSTLRRLFKRLGARSFFQRRPDFE